MVWSGVLSWGGVCEGGSCFLFFLSPTLQSKTAEKRVLKIRRAGDCCQITACSVFQQSLVGLKS